MVKVYPQSRSEEFCPACGAGEHQLHSPGCPAVYRVEDRIKANDIMDQGAKTYKERNLIYGDNYKLVGPVMSGFFPNGILINSNDYHNRFHIFMLIIVKLTRYAMNWDSGGHRDSIHDAMVYCAMLEEIDNDISERKARENNQAADGGGLGRK